ncbi:actin-like protein arp8 [Dispira parvispora]|uniref:Actin-like protein arp8 n=1 Tax=Dispira parvispora TaxID=1520584 RepID=A0A9W8ASE4_9FUNG|nr:actin-like protein arp8 [Dispira parvispora]
MSDLKLPRKRQYSWLPNHHPSAVSAVSEAQAESEAEGKGTKSTLGKASIGAAGKAGESSDTVRGSMGSEEGSGGTGAERQRRRRKPEVDNRKVRGGSEKLEFSTTTSRSERPAVKSMYDDPVIRDLLGSDDEYGGMFERLDHQRRQGKSTKSSLRDGKGRPVDTTDEPVDIMGNGDDTATISSESGVHQKVDEGGDTNTPAGRGKTTVSQRKRKRSVDGSVAGTPTSRHRRLEDVSKDTPGDETTPGLSSKASSPAPSSRRLAATANGKSGTSRLSTPVGRSSGAASKVVNRNPNLKYTTFPSYNTISTKSVASNYLKSESSYVGIPDARPVIPLSPMSPRESSDLDAATAEPTAEVLPPPAKPVGTIVIHPGSQYLRIGKSTDIYPQAVPQVIARRTRCNRRFCQRVREEYLSSATLDEPSDESSGADAGDSDLKEDEQGTPENQSKSFKASREHELAQITKCMEEELKQRLRDAKRRSAPVASSILTNFNVKSRQPEIISDHNDPYKVEWTAVTDKPDFIVGTSALRIPDALPASLLSTLATEKNSAPWLAQEASQAGDTDTQDEYLLWWPIQRGQFNQRDYTGIEAVMGDLQDIWTWAIEQELGIKRQEFQQWSVVLVIPDLYHPHQVESLVRLVLCHMGFARVIIQQESVCVTFGAGISSACIVDIGAQKTSVVCVEDGYCLPTTRVQAQYGGDDITRTFTELLKQRQFPYVELNLNRAYDWNLMDELKEKYVTLSEIDVTVQVYDFVVRVPRSQARKFRFKVYDEPYFAALALFYPQILPLLTPVNHQRSIRDSVDIAPSGGPGLNHADPGLFPPGISSSATFLLGPNASMGSSSVASLHDFSGHDTNKNRHTYGLTWFGKIPMVLTPLVPTPTLDSQAIANGVADTGSEHANNTKKGRAGKASAAESAVPSPAPQGLSESEGGANASTSVMNTPQMKPTTVATTTAVPSDLSTLAATTPQPKSEIAEESSKASSEPQWISVPDEQAPHRFMPLDALITHCISHSGPEERCKRYYANIIVVGGGAALIPLFAEFLQHRLLLSRPSHLQGIEKIQVLPSPRDMDPRLLAWKGASVLCKLDIADELWISEREWREIGTKCFKHRLLFFCQEIGDPDYPEAK